MKLPTPTHGEKRGAAKTIGRTADGVDPPCAVLSALLKPEQVLGTCGIVARDGKAHSRQLRWRLQPHAMNP